MHGQAGPRRGRPRSLGGGRLAIPTEPLLTIVGYQFIPSRGILAAVSTYFFRKTGNVYVGAFLPPPRAWRRGRRHSDSRHDPCSSPRA